MRKSTQSISLLSGDMLSTEKQLLDKKMHDQENSFNAVFEMSPSVNLILSKDLTILQANTALVNLLGLSTALEAVGCNVLQFVHPSHCVDWLLMHQCLWIHNLPTFALETCLVKKNGTAIWCKLTCISYQEDGSTLGYTIIEDVSRWKKDEESIKRTDANLLTILNYAESGYVLYNAKLKIVSFNALAQKFAHMLYGKELTEGSNLLEYFPAERHPVLMDATSRVMNGEDICYELPINNPDGEQKWMEAKWINVRDDNNKSWGFILASKDITEDKLTAMEREKITHDLIQRNKALEQFTNITSHNLRAPVANIIGLAELIEEMGANEEDRKEMMDGIMQSARNLDMVITDINDILHVKHLFHEIKEKINLKQLVNDIKVSISGMLQKENVTITCSFKPENIYSTRSYLYSIFYNMILNSVKYRRLDTDPEIILTSSIADNKLKLTFKDNGKGIDLHRHGNSLFGLYQRFDASVQGRGLGLFMVKTQIETLNGTIAVKSELGNGTEFVVEFPV